MKILDKMIFVKYARPKPPREGREGGFNKREGFKQEGRDRNERNNRDNDRGNFGGRGRDREGNHRPRNEQIDRPPRREERGFGYQDRKEGGYQKRERSNFEYSPQRIIPQGKPSTEDYDY